MTNIYKQFFDIITRKHTVRDNFSDPSSKFISNSLDKFSSCFYDSILENGFKTYKYHDFKKKRKIFISKLLTLEPGGTLDDLGYSSVYIYEKFFKHSNFYIGYDKSGNVLSHTISYIKTMFLDKNSTKKIVDDSFRRIQFTFYSVLNISPCFLSFAEPYSSILVKCIKSSVNSER